MDFDTVDESARKYSAMDYAHVEHVEWKKEGETKRKKAFLNTLEELCSSMTTAVDE